MEKISIIGQCYNEEKMLPIFYKELKKTMDKMNYVKFEVIFMDDNSTDKSLNIIKKIVEKDNRIKCISMSRNFGREACAMAGFKYATGDYITTMDLDLQDPPELLIEMYKALHDNSYDIAAAKVTTRKGYSFFHKICTKIFFNIINKISSVKMIDGQREYRLMKRKVVDGILEYKEYNLFNKGLLNDIGFKTKWIEYENIERIAGNTKFTYKRMIKYATTGILDYSLVPLKFILFFGLFISFLSFILLLLIIIFYCFNLKMDFLALWLIFGILFLFGIQITFMGVISLYLSQIHLEVKNRPLYIVREFVNIE
jgi:glucosyltransferase